MTSRVEDIVERNAHRQRDELIEMVRLETGATQAEIEAAITRVAARLRRGDRWR